jgi:hypothetical protein
MGFVTHEFWYKAPPVEIREMWPSRRAAHTRSGIWELKGWRAVRRHRRLRAGCERK